MTRCVIVTHKALFHLLGALHKTQYGKMHPQLIFLLTLGQVHRSPSSYLPRLIDRRRFCSHDTIFRGAHRNRTLRAGRFRTTVAVPMPFEAGINHLDGRWTGRSRPVQDRQCTSVTAVKMVGRVSHMFSHSEFLVTAAVLPHHTKLSSL